MTINQIGFRLLLNLVLTFVIIRWMGVPWNTPAAVICTFMYAAFLVSLHGLKLN